ncbi:hypothetical protein [Saccharopolyspora dendranthemae]|uniref:hypothetical protein n=1 Tax=Saccharopolyspora dendranthemae TaxID=1181886 RepID=UPI0011A5C895|nr:hypothetical protein [Saccharopolyspora dendranthemae]
MDARGRGAEDPTSWGGARTGSVERLILSRRGLDDRAGADPKGRTDDHRNRRPAAEPSRVHDKSYDLVAVLHQSLPNT